MWKRFGEVDRLKKVLDFPSEVEEIYDDKYVRSVYERLYGRESTLSEKTLLAASDLPYSLRPKVEIYTKKEETKEEKIEEKIEEPENKVEIEVIKSEVEEPEFIKVIPKREEEFPQVEVVEEWKTEELPEWRAEEETPEWVEAEIPFTVKGYTLYKKEVELRSGKIQTIYFFSKRKPRSGDLCPLPDGYEVKVNKRSGMPYLKLIEEREEKKEEYYEKNGYRLYKKEVKLRSGKVQTIYFFSRKRPKSGRQCALPDGYTVKINKRSGMPYLRKKRKE